jgi:hypothetical protein
MKSSMAADDLKQLHMTLLLEPWPDLYRNAMTRRGQGWINLLQAAAARVERAL